MPAPIVAGIIEFITAQLEVTCWDGEVPHYNTDGDPIVPGGAATPAIWPVVKVYMQEGGFNREWTTEDPYSDRGEILIQVWGTTRASVQATMDDIEALLAKASNWAQIDLGGPAENPYYVIQMLLDRWYIGQEEGERTADSELLYRVDMHYDTMIHGAISTE